VLPLPTSKAVLQAGGLGDAEAEEVPSGIGRYRVGASDPISQKVAAELQDSVRKSPAGGGKYEVTKDSISRAISAKRRAEAEAALDKEASGGGCFSGGAEGGSRGFLCCAAPARTKE
jgi:hypothetical protein